MLNHRPELDIQNIIIVLIIEVDLVIQSTEVEDRCIMGIQLLSGGIQQQRLAHPIVSNDHQEMRSVRILSFAARVQDLGQGIDDHQLEMIVTQSST